MNIVPIWSWRQCCYENSWHLGGPVVSLLYWLTAASSCSSISTSSGNYLPSSASSFLNGMVHDRSSPSSATMIPEKLSENQRTHEIASLFIRAIVDRQARLRQRLPSRRRRYSPSQVTVDSELRLKLKYDPITSKPHDDLHWLQIRQRIWFKQCIHAHLQLSVYGTAPEYTAKMRVLVPTSSYYMRRLNRADAECLKQAILNSIVTVSDIPVCVSNLSW